MIWEYYKRAHTPQNIVRGHIKPEDITELGDKITSFSEAGAYERRIYKSCGSDAGSVGS